MKIPTTEQIDAGVRYLIANDTGPLETDGFEEQAGKSELLSACLQGLVKKVDESVANGEKTPEEGFALILDGALRIGVCIGLRMNEPAAKGAARGGGA
jgi:hypothetical protein